jgi:hypothetical protein
MYDHAFLTCAVNHVFQSARSLLVGKGGPSLKARGSSCGGRLERSRRKIGLKAVAERPKNVKVKFCYLLNGSES